MSFVDGSFIELKVKDRHDAEAYAKITNDAFQGVARKNKGSAATLIDDKVAKMVASFYATLLEGPIGTTDASEKVLALIAKSRADRKKAEEAAKKVNAAGGAGTGKHAGRVNERESKFEYNTKGIHADDEDYYEEEEEEEEEKEAVKPVVVTKSLAEIEAERKAAAAAFVMPKKTGAKTLRL